MPVTNRLAAARLVKQKYARQVVEGLLSPHDGAQKIVGLLYDIEQELPKTQQHAGFEFGVGTLAGHYYELDDPPANDPEVRREIEEGIVAACRRIARGEDDRE